MKLTDIASQLKEKARRTGQARRALPRGLGLALRHYQQDSITRIWILSLSRIAVLPSEEEERICRDAFGVTTEAQRETDQKRVINMAGRGAHVTIYHIIRLQWTEVEAEQLGFGVESSETRERYYG